MTQTDVSPQVLPRLVAFDLDDTLAPSKSAMPPAMATALRRLLDVVDAFINNIGVVSSAIIMCVAVAWVLRRTRLLQDHLNAVSESRMIGLWWRALVGAVVPVLLGYMFFQTLWTYLSEGYESESYSSGFVMVFGWGMLLVVALGTAVMSLIPWRTPVDEFEALTLEAASQEED